MLLLPAKVNFRATLDTLTNEDYGAWHLAPPKRLDPKYGQRQSFSLLIPRDSEFCVFNIPVLSET
jgi:hypothetical protein